MFVHHCCLGNNREATANRSQGVTNIICLFGPACHGAITEAAASQKIILRCRDAAFLTALRGKAARLKTANSRASLHSASESKSE